MTMQALDDLARTGLLGLADAAIRATLLALVVAGALALFRVRRAGLLLHAWTFILCGALAMPIAGWLLPALDVHLPELVRAWMAPLTSRSAGGIRLGTIAAGGSTVPAVSGIPIALIFWVLYLAGVSWLSLKALRA